ncbi:MAG TPA: DUF1573 domain-containing protein [Vicinamibacteria bacterium]|nr:DUF1573 domain-containing protein [Vicinamibacteria bacterium]
MSPLAALVLLAALDGGAHGAPPRVAVEPPGFDFGRLVAGRTVTKEIVVRNHGGRPLQVESISTTCGCTVVGAYGRELAPGARTAVRISFTAPDTPGRTEKSVLVKTNDPDRPSVEVKLAAEVVPPSRRK